MVKFTNPETAERFESDFEDHRHVHVPGGTAGDGWAGELKDITPQACEKLIEQKSNLVTPKSKSTSKPPKDSAQ